jgi:hypothetical protein
MHFFRIKDKIRQMRFFIPDMTEFFFWMDQQRLRYVVLRGFLDFDHSYPAPGAAADIDLLVEDGAIPELHARYGDIGKKEGTKCDFHTVSGEDALHLLPPEAQQRNWKNKFYPEKSYPDSLSRAILGNRRLWKGKFYVPSPRDQLTALLYHIAYQKGEAAGIDISDPEKARNSKYRRELDLLTAELGLSLPYTLTAFHAYLRNAGHSISYKALTERLRHYPPGKFHDHFLAMVCADRPGEMNLFVIRGAAVRKGLHIRLIRALQRHYRIVMIKGIPLLTRTLKSGQMRGGKWRRGGRPWVAVVVFDPSPIPATAEERKVQRLVFNSRQFIKRDLREWFTKKTGARPSINPIHSTDNEAEAINHLPLFFTPEEQEEIIQKVANMRRNLR